MPTGPQLRDNLLQKTSGPQQDHSAVSYAMSGQLHLGEVLRMRAQDVPTVSEVHLTKPKDLSISGQAASLQDIEQPLKAHLLHIPESSQHFQSHIQV